MQPKPDAPHLGEGLLDEHEVAAKLGISIYTLRGWRGAGKMLPYVRVGHGVRYAPSDIRAFIASRKVLPLAATEGAAR
jgi:predicted site-specific integrase-resolvase